jgi:hypothetical protein
MKLLPLAAKAGEIMAKVSATKGQQVRCLPPPQALEKMLHDIFSIFVALIIALRSFICGVEKKQDPAPAPYVLLQLPLSTPFAPAPGGWSGW